MATSFNDTDPPPWGEEPPPPGDDDAPVPRVSAGRRSRADPPRQDAPSPDPAVYATLAMTQSRTTPTPRPCDGNLAKILRDDPRWGAALRLNELGGTIELRGEILTEGRGVSDVQEWLEDVYKVFPKNDAVFRAVRNQAEVNRYNPVREYLNGLRWDGKPRIRLVVSEVLHAVNDDTASETVELYQKYVRRFLISAVARALRPGCKVDTALILVGEQGANKSTFFHDLFGEGFFADSPIPIGNKDAFAQLSLVWGYEAAEMDSLSRATAEQVKQFLSSRADNYRAPYHRTAAMQARHSVMCGTTNRPQHLADPSGSRRFWCIRIPPGVEIDLGRLRAMRDDLWAEAVAAYQAGESWWFDRSEEAARAVDAEQFTVIDPWEEAVTEWAEGRGPFTTASVMREALHFRTSLITQPLATRVNEILRRAGYESKNTRKPDNRGWARMWHRVEGHCDAAKAGR